MQDRLRDLVADQDHFIGLGRSRRAPLPQGNAEWIAAAFPHLAGCIKPAVNTDQLEACSRAGMITEGKLEREGVMVRTLHSRALMVRPLGARRP